MRLASMASVRTGISGIVLTSGKLYDNLSISTAAVPEPESYAMMLAGLSLMSVIARRRRYIASL